MPDNITNIEPLPHDTDTFSQVEHIVDKINECIAAIKYLGEQKIPFINNKGISEIALLGEIAIASEKEDPYDADLLKKLHAKYFGGGKDV